MPCEHCVSRRHFLAHATAGLGVAAAIAACGDGDVSGIAAARLPPGVVPSEKVTIVVAEFAGLATQGILVKVASFYAVKRSGATTFDAFSMACTHEGCLTNIENGQTFHCSCHGSNFANDGSVINGPFTGETIGPLMKLPTSYDPATDVLTIN